MFLRVNGTELYFDVEGPGLVADGNVMREQPTLLVLHGSFYDHSYLRPAFTGLSGEAQIVYLDLRGHGRSAEAPAESGTLDRLAEDIAAFCAALKIRRPIVFGHSFGGFVAQTLMLKHPDLASKLILSNSAAHGDLRDSLAVLEQRQGPEARRVAETVLQGHVEEAHLAEFAGLVLPAYTHPATGFALSYLERCIIRLPLPAYFFAHYLASYDLRGKLQAISQPTLVISGDYDWITLPSHAREIAGTIPHSRLVSIPDAGHFTPGERPQLFAEAIRQFLR